MADPIRILVADDHPVVRDGLMAILGTQPDFAVVGEAGTGAEAVEQARELRPDVMLLDLEMPELDGVEVLRRLSLSNPEVRVIVFTAFDTDERILGAVQAGAQGYLLKGAPRKELFEAVRVVHAGGGFQAAAPGKPPGPAQRGRGADVARAGGAASGGAGAAK